MYSNCAKGLFTYTRNGLPQEHAYDLTYRHRMDISADGDLLAFGSTTGSLWASDDQSDSWRTVSEHLPPVNAVRIVCCGLRLLAAAFCSAA